MDLTEFASKTTTIDLEKEWDDLSAAELMPIDWYEVEIFKVEVKKNRKWLDGNDEAGHEVDSAEVDGAGTNLVLILKTIEAPSPQFNGRTLFKYLPMPNPTDKGKFDMNGQDIGDSKRSNLFNWADAFGATIQGSSIEFATGLKARVYVHQDKDMNGQLANTLKFEEPQKIQELEGSGLI